MSTTEETMSNLISAIALEGMYQIMVQRGARWSRKQFFRIGKSIVRKHPEYLGRAVSARSPTARAAVTSSDSESNVNYVEMRPLRRD
jgi:hypothetical protein